MNGRVYRRDATGAEKSQGEPTTRLTPRQAGGQQAASLPSVVEIVAASDGGLKDGRYKFSDNGNGAQPGVAMPRKL